MHCKQVTVVLAAELITGAEPFGFGYVSRILYGELKPFMPA
jgi:hypothetical protein